MGNDRDTEEIDFILDDYPEIEDYTVDVEDIVFEEEMERQRKRDERRIKNYKKAKKRKRIKVALLVLEIFVVLILELIVTAIAVPNAKEKFLSSCVGQQVAKLFLSEEKYGNIQDKEFDENKINTNEELDLKNYEDYITIALFGIDSREGSLDVGLSDSIIVVSINTKTKEARMSSIYRDTLISIETPDGYTYLDKATSAFSVGGVEGAINTLNRNLDLNITDYAVVNFGGLATIIDAFGGIDVNITEDERYYINGYLVETRQVTGMYAPDVTQSGNVHLDGLQATAFCRIRYVPFHDEDGQVYNDDFGRTARQRFVIKQLISKAKALGINDVLTIADELFEQENPAFKTSLTYDEIMELLPLLIEFSLGGTQGFPYTFEGGWYDIYGTGQELSIIAVQGLEYNATKLHEFLYPDEKYKSTTTLKNISNELEFKLGVGEVKLPEDQGQTTE